MRLDLADHPLFHRFSHWKDRVSAGTAARAVRREAALVAREYLKSRGYRAMAYCAQGRYYCLFKAGPELLGWVNVSRDYCAPRAALLDAPLIMTAALNDLPPRLDLKPLSWMEAVGCCPAMTRPAPEFMADPWAKGKWTGGPADFFLTPPHKVVVHAHWTELPRVALGLARAQADWLAGGDYDVPYDEYGQEAAYVRWTPLADEVYGAWEKIRGSMDEDGWARTIRALLRAAGRRASRASRGPWSPPPGGGTTPRSS